MKTDYTELEGKEIMFDTGRGLVKALVIGCQYNVGISIVANKTSMGYCVKGEHLYCLTHPDVGEKKGLNVICSKAEYRRRFFNKLKQIKEGVFLPNGLDPYYKSAKTYSGSIFTIPPTVCPFN